LSGLSHPHCDIPFGEALHVIAAPEYASYRQDQKRREDSVGTNPHFRVKQPNSDEHRVEIPTKHAVEQNARVLPLL
jgi:hypothetical protein